MEDTSDQILEYLAGYLFERGEAALFYVDGEDAEGIEVEIIDYYGDGLYSVRIPGLWDNLEDEVIVFPGKDLTPIK
jgi:hypothetical protein